MGIAEDLHDQARHLAVYQGDNPTQASLRRAASTAYYALFHLLIQDAALRWDGSSESRSGVERAFSHGQMKNISLRFQGPIWQDWRETPQAIPPELRRVAAAFADLQEKRHKADYDNQLQWSFFETESVLNLAAAAFQDWAAIREHPMAGNYLMAMLIQRARQ